MKISIHMNKFEQKHEELKKQLAMIGIFDSEAEIREIKVTPVYSAADNVSTEAEGDLVPMEEKSN